MTPAVGVRVVYLDVISNAKACRGRAKHDVYNQRGQEAQHSRMRLWDKLGCSSEAVGEAGDG